VGDGNGAVLDHIPQRAEPTLCVRVRVGVNERTQKDKATCRDARGVEELLQSR
jgi:hypothetical protein